MEIQVDFAHSGHVATIVYIHRLHCGACLLLELCLDYLAAWRDDLVCDFQVLVSSAFRWLFMSGGKLTIVGHLVNIFFTVDQEADGAIIELGK